MKETQNKNNKKALKFHNFRSRVEASSSSPSPFPSQSLPHPRLRFLPLFSSRSMSGRESFGIGLEQSGLHPQTTTMQTMRLAYSAEGTPVYKPVTAPTPQFSSAPGITTTTGGGGGGGGGGTVVGSNDASPTTGIVPHGANAGVGDEVKRKRGRPRKYGPDGAMALGLSPVSPAGSSPTGASMKKARGRPPGSGKKQQMAALGSSGVGFTPHVITVKVGEDVSSKIMSFSQNGPRAICILSANGALSNVTLRQAATSGTVTYEGRFEILSLSGSFLLTESGGQRSRTGGLSVSLASSDGRVLGGGVAGLLMAASPVQVVVGSFIAEGRKESKSYISSDPSSLQPKLVPCGGSTGAVSPPSRGTLSESSGGAGSPLNQSTGACNNNNSNNNPHIFGNMPWK